MKTYEPAVLLALLATLVSALSSAAEETAVVKDARVNVRGQPSLVGEVITQLQKGEKVIVLEEITVAKPKTNEPPRWARIQMPPNTPVWVFAPFLDLTNKAVKVPRLNLRAGPGENYSVIGRLQRGAPITEIRRVEQWVEIETPPGAYAFVAADLLSKGNVEAAATPPRSEPPKVASAQPVATMPVQPTEPQDAPTPLPLAETKATPAVVPAPEAPSPLPASEPKGDATIVRPPQVVTTASPPPAVIMPKPAAESTVLPRAVIAAPAVQVPPAPERGTTGILEKNGRALAEENLVRRVVRHEGIVRSTASIQAPTYYELLSAENRKTLNYLHVDKLGLELKDYRGRRVIVTGEEAIDPRWPKTPVIEVDHLELIP